MTLYFTTFGMSKMMSIDHSQTQRSLHDKQQVANEDASNDASNPDENNYNSEKDDQGSKGANEADKMGKAAATGVEDADLDSIDSLLVAVT